jgi:hypothetical protein
VQQQNQGGGASTIYLLRGDGPLNYLEQYGNFPFRYNHLREYEMEDKHQARTLTRNISFPIHASDVYIIIYDNPSASTKSYLNVHLQVDASTYSLVREPRCDAVETAQGCIWSSKQLVENSPTKTSCIVAKAVSAQQGSENTTTTTTTTKLVPPSDKVVETVQVRVSSTIPDPDPPSSGQFVYFGGFLVVLIQFMLCCCWRCFYCNMTTMTTTTTPLRPNIGATPEETTQFVDDPGIVGADQLPIVVPEEVVPVAQLVYGPGIGVA